MQLPLLVYLHDLNYLVIKENSYVHLDRIDTMFIMILANFKATKFLISFYIQQLTDAHLQFEAEKAAWGKVHNKPILNIMTNTDDAGKLEVCVL